MVKQIDKVLYTAQSHTTGGRDGGAGQSSDGALEVKLTPPGSGKPGTCAGLNLNDRYGFGFPSASKTY